MRGRGATRLAARRAQADQLVERPSASARSRSRRLACTLRPAVSTWIVTSRSRRCTGPSTRRRLCTFSSGTHARHAPEPAARRHDVRVVAAPRQVAVAQRALPPRAARRAQALGGRAREDAREQVERDRAAADREHGAELLALDGALALALLLAGDVDLEPAPAERPPQQRLDHPHGLHAAGPDRLGGQRDEAAAQAQPVGALGDRHAVGVVEPPPDDREHREQRQEAAADEAPRRRPATRPRSRRRRSRSASVIRP